MKKTERCG